MMSSSKDRYTTVDLVSHILTTDAGDTMSSLYRKSVLLMLSVSCRNFSEISIGFIQLPEQLIETVTGHSANTKC